MANFNINDEQLKQVYEEILTDLQKLSKAEPEEEMPKKDKEEEEKKKEEMGKKTEKTELPTEENEDAKLHEILEDEDQEEGEEEYSYEELKQDYANLPLETLKLHYLAAKEAIASKMNEEAEEKEEVKPMVKVMQKSESPKVTKKLQKMEKQMESLQKALEKMVSLPLGRKAVTEVSAIKKNESAPKELTPSEVMSKLRSVAAAPTLSKSDRDLINQYCLGQIDHAHIGHLLEK